jgi:hypothetical protein
MKVSKQVNTHLCWLHVCALQVVLTSAKETSKRVEGSDASAAASSANKVCCICNSSTDTHTNTQVSLGSICGHAVVHTDGRRHSVHALRSL